MSQVSDLNAKLLLAERERDSAREENLRYRDKLLSYAKECAECGGTGVVTVMAPPESRLYSGVQISREVECPTCLDIRELLL